jgi:hypothetical protein
MSDLKMTPTRADPSTTPHRLYQLLGAPGSGVVVFLKESAERLRDRYGWTAQRVDLQEDEARYLRRTTGQDVKAGQAAWLMRCDGVARQTAPGEVTCSAPAGLERLVLRPGSLAEPLLAPAVQFVPARMMEFAFVFEVEKDAPAMMPAARVRADLGMKAYREVEAFYRAYANGMAALPEQGTPDLFEANLMVQVRNTLARLAQPVAELRRAVGAQAEGLAPAPLLVGQADAFIGAIFIARDADAALRLMAATAGEVEAALGVVAQLRGPICKRVDALLRRGIVKRQDQRRAVAMLQALLGQLDCPAPVAPSGAWKAWAAIGAGALALGVGLNVYRSRSN